MVEIHLALRWVDHEDRVVVFLLADLLMEYSRRVGIQKTRNTTVGIVQDGPDSSTMWQTINLRLIPFDDWNGFSKWCRAQGIDVVAMKKVIDGTKTWWPSVIRIDADPCNERLVMAKLLHL